MAKRKIGEYLIDLGVLNEKQVDEILAYSKASGIRFGEAAVRLGLLKSEYPVPSFRHAHKVDFFHLNPDYFPKATKDLFTMDLMLNYGVLPLGYKTKGGFFRSTKQLNVGLLDPTRKDAIRAIENFAHTKLGKEFGGMKVYLVLADEFLHVLEKHYNTNVAALRKKNVSNMDRTLHAYLSAHEAVHSG